MTPEDLADLAALTQSLATMRVVQISDASPEASGQLPPRGEIQAGSPRDIGAHTNAVGDNIATIVQDARFAIISSARVMAANGQAEKAACASDDAKLGPNHGIVGGMSQASALVGW
jgi:hypothetical protein